MSRVNARAVPVGAKPPRPPGHRGYPVALGDGRIPAALGYTGLQSTFFVVGFEAVHENDSPKSTVRRVIVRRDI